MEIDIKVDLDNFDLTPERRQSMNKKIATYLGYTYVPHNDKTLSPQVGWQKLFHDGRRVLVKNGGPGRSYLCRSHNELRYSNDWNWLVTIAKPLLRKDYSLEFEPHTFLYTRIVILQDMLLTTLTELDRRKTFLLCGFIVEFVEEHSLFEKYFPDNER